eukprot:2418194-Amphidinium_carterae.1
MSQCFDVLSGHLASSKQTLESESPTPLSDMVPQSRNLARLHTSLGTELSILLNHSQSSSLKGN